MDPALEHIMAMSWKTFSSFSWSRPQSTHDAHLNFMGLNMVQNNPPVMASLQKNILRTHKFNGTRTSSIRICRRITRIQ